MRALKSLSMPLFAALALTACGGELPEEPINEPADRHLLDEEEPVLTGVGTKPEQYQDACEGIDGVMARDFAVRQNDDMMMLDGVATLDGDLAITGGTTLGDLRCLRQVTGDLIIQGTDSLKELAGFERLELVGGGVWIVGNTQLASLDQLESLKRVGGDIVVERNETLTDLDGLAKVGGDLRGALVIRDNDSLRRVNGFDRLGSIADGVTIAGNPSLESISGFGGRYGVTTSFGDVVVEDNELLGRATLPMMGADESRGSLVVQDNPRLKELAMHSDRRVRVAGDFIVRNNEALRDFVGFTNVQIVMGELRIENNDAFSSFAGLAGVEGVGGDLTVIGNDSMTSLDMVGLESIGEDLVIGKNRNLTSLDGLGALREVFGVIDFFDNPMLTDCSMEELVTRIETGRAESRCTR